YLRSVTETHPTPSAAIKKGIANPAEYADSNETPVEIEPPLKASVRIAPSTGPTQGAHPAEKKTPIKAEERYPHLRSGTFWTRVSYSRSGMRKTPIICSPKRITMTPPILESQKRMSKSSPPRAEANTPTVTKTTLNPSTNARPCVKV